MGSKENDPSGQLTDVTNTTEPGIAKYLIPSTPIGNNANVLRDLNDTSLGPLASWQNQMSTPLVRGSASCARSDNLKSVSSNAQLKHSSTFNEQTPPKTELPEFRLSEIPLAARNVPVFLTDGRSEVAGEQSFESPDFQKHAEHIMSFANDFLFSHKPLASERKEQEGFGTGIKTSSSMEQKLHDADESSFQVFVKDPRKQFDQGEKSIERQNLFDGTTPPNAAQSLLGSIIEQQKDTSQLDGDKIFGSFKVNESLFGPVSSYSRLETVPEHTYSLPGKSDTQNVAEKSEQFLRPSENMSRVWSTMANKFRSIEATKSRDDDKTTTTTQVGEERVKSGAASTSSTASECGSSASATLCAPKTTTSDSRGTTPVDLATAAAMIAITGNSATSSSTGSHVDAPQHNILSSLAGQMLQAQTQPFFVFNGYPTETSLHIDMGFVCLHDPKHHIITVFNASFFQQRYNVLDASLKIDGELIDMPSRCVSVQRPSVIEVQPLRPCPIEILLTCHRVGLVDVLLTISNGHMAYKVWLHANVIWPTIKLSVPEPFGATERTFVDENETTPHAQFSTAVNVRNCSGCAVPVELELKGDSNTATISFIPTGQLARTKLYLRPNSSSPVEIFVARKSHSVNQGGLRLKLKAFIDVEDTRNQNPTAVRVMTF